MLCKTRCTTPILIIRFYYTLVHQKCQIFLLKTYFYIISLIKHLTGILNQFNLLSAFTLQITLPEVIIELHNKTERLLLPPLAF